MTRAPAWPRDAVPLRCRAIYLFSTHRYTYPNAGGGLPQNTYIPLIGIDYNLSDTEPAIRAINFRINGGYNTYNALNVRA